MTHTSISDKPFTEYTLADWDAYNRRSAEQLRTDADRYRDQFSPETLQRWLDDAACLESKIGTEGR